MLAAVEGRRIAFDRPQKWVWYDQRYTIFDLAQYYVAVSPWMLPHPERRWFEYQAYRAAIHVRDTPLDHGVPAGEVSGLDADSLVDRRESEEDLVFAPRPGTTTF